MLLHEFQQVVGFLQCPLPDVQRGYEFGDGVVDFFLLAFALFLVLQMAFFLVLLLTIFLLLGCALLASALLPFLPLVALLAAGVEPVVHANFLEVVVGEQQREVALAIAAHAKNVLVLLLRERWVFGVDVLHDVGDLLGVEAASMLEPDNPAVDPAIVAVRPQLVGQLLEHIVLTVFEGASPVGGELMGEQFPLAVEVGPEDVGLVAGL